MRSNMTFAIASGVITLLAAQVEAEARSTFRNLVPNGYLRSCQTCHISASGGQGWNDFGTDVRERLSEGRPDWAAVFSLDSDGDGQTNGEELGDPCGTWLPGRTAPRTVEISAPGDPASTSAQPRTPGCTPDAGFPPDTGPASPIDGGAADTGGPAMDAGFAPAVDAGASPGPGNEEDGGGCTCARDRGATGWAVLGFGLTLWWLARRHRARP